MKKISSVKPFLTSLCSLALVGPGWPAWYNTHNPNTGEKALTAYCHGNKADPKVKIKANQVFLCNITFLDEVSGNKFCAMMLIRKDNKILMPAVPCYRPI